MVLSRKQPIEHFVFDKLAAQCGVPCCNQREPARCKDDKRRDAWQRRPRAQRDRATGAKRERGSCSQWQQGWLRPNNWMLAASSQ